MRYDSNNSLASAAKRTTTCIWKVSTWRTLVETKLDTSYYLHFKGFYSWIYTTEAYEYLNWDVPGFNDHLRTGEKPCEFRASALTLVAFSPRESAHVEYRKWRQNIQIEHGAASDSRNGGKKFWLQGLFCGNIYIQYLSLNDRLLSKDYPQKEKVSSNWYFFSEKRYLENSVD